MRVSTEKFNNRVIFMLINPASGGLIILFTERGLEMTETERIANEVMDRNNIPSREQVELDKAWAATGYEELGIGFDHTGQYHYPLANVLGEGPNVSELRNDDGIAFFTGIRNALAFEVLAGLVIWGAWELHRPIMLLTHWLVSHAR